MASSTQNIASQLELVCNNFLLEEYCAVLGRYAASSGDPLPTSRYNLSVPVFKGQTLVRNHHYALHNNSEGRISNLLRDGSLKSCSFLLHATVSHNAVMTSTLYVIVPHILPTSLPTDASKNDCSAVNSSF